MSDGPGMSDGPWSDQVPQPLRRNLMPNSVFDPPPAPKRRKLDGEIRWAPVAFTRRLPMTGTAFNAVRDALVKVFGEFPIKLEYNPENHPDDANLLKAMAAAAGDGGEPFDDLRTALMKYHGLVLSEK